LYFPFPCKVFEFEKALMQEHYNSKKFLNTKAFPKAKFECSIINVAAINFSSDGTYEEIKGNLTIKDVTKPINTKGTITVKVTTVNVQTKFNITLPVDNNVSLLKILLEFFLGAYLLRVYKKCLTIPLMFCQEWFHPSTHCSMLFTKNMPAPA
jgi:hypothetical protein